MPDLLDSADPGRGSRQLSAERGARSAEREALDSSRAALPAPRSALPAQSILVFERVSKWYGPVIGVNQVTLELRAGITGLVGANGAGKTTLLRLATGQLRPDLGRVYVAGRRAWRWTAKRLVGYCHDPDGLHAEMSGGQLADAIRRLCGS